MWVHIVDSISNQKQEGHAVVMSRSWNPVTVDAWGLKRFEKRLEDERKRGKKDVYYSLDDKISAFEELPGFIDVMKFRWVRSDIWAEYEAIKKSVNVDDEEIVEDKQSVQLENWKRRTILAIRIFKGLGYTSSDIAKVFKAHPQSVASWIKQFKDEEEIKKINQPI